MNQAKKTAQTRKQSFWNQQALAPEKKTRKA
jgi:hypothetical protein